MRLLTPGTDPYWDAKELSNDRCEGKCTPQDYDAYKAKMRQRLEHALDHVTTIGPHGEVRGNILSKLSDKVVWGILTAMVGGAWSAGWFVGRYYSDTEKIEMRRDLNEARDSLKTLSTRPSHLVPEEQPDTAGANHAEQDTTTKQ
jgi:hypothetical protein